MSIRMDKTMKESYRANVFLTSSQHHPKCSLAIFFLVNLAM